MAQSLDSYPCFKSSPQLGVVAAIHNPEIKAVMEEIAAAMVKGAKVTNVETTLGSKCLNIILTGLAPITWLRRYSPLIFLYTEAICSMSSSSREHEHDNQK